MKIHLETSGANFIRSYTAGCVTIGQDAYRASLIVTPERIIADWPPQTVEELTASHLEVVAALAPEVVILGTGARLRFPPPAHFLPLIATGIGYESMGTGAACRTDNVLMGEGRRVAAVLLMIEK